mmetsp:Transcript_5772/g.14419  ORF Transcript_5772/g.14419 Transcript_5772/m.14419 type:complete len:279 (-) Transcript_5772:241-1077(-)|eukprot:CAMPEP_0197189436 /NCGR_PEP_ID=MMETSP1423-20130617/19737_1 /TAXON_ID=476441 /ORGANISM="Pseudo-nitzschia heimii, Strain UNC1101" /LENGTH=278 /DNA_ID=CAMNT_0042641543 /DNA_START=174 /DNA_END=1010 /DNA_ORIENTATION=-
MSLSSLITVLVLVLPFGNAFIREKTAIPTRDLSQLVEAQCDQRLSLALDIGNRNDISRLAIKGMEFDLTKQIPNSNDEFVKMPGVHGPKPSSSGGIKTLNIVQDGSFISMAGCETVKPMKGCWEIIWKEGAKSGSLLCGFETGKNYNRNDATLPQGIVYVSFNTWSSEGLKRAQELKERTSKRANGALQRKDEELAKMAETTNVFQKALHYYNALSAAEVYARRPHARMELVPNTDQVAHFKEDMYVSTNGHVWTQELPSGKPSVLGTAKMQLISNDA